jgi:hypothetical protein
MIRLPWISRERFEELKNERELDRQRLEARIAELDMERRKLVDALSQVFIGKPIFGQPPAPPVEDVIRKQQELANIDPERDELEEAVRLAGRRNARAVTAVVERNRDMRYKREHADASREIEEILDQAEREGAEAAQKAAGTQ